MSEKKPISLAKLQLGLTYIQALEDGDDTGFSKLLALYNVPDDATVWQLRTNPEMLEALAKTASTVGSDEAAEDIAFFMQAVARFSEKLLGSMPKGALQTTTKKDKN